MYDDEKLERAYIKGFQNGMDFALGKKKLEVGDVIKGVHHYVITKIEYVPKPDIYLYNTVCVEDGDVATFTQALVDKMVYTGRHIELEFLRKE